MPSETKTRKRKSPIERAVLELGGRTFSLTKKAFGHLPPGWINPLGKLGGNLVFACLRRKRSLTIRNLQHVLDLPSGGAASRLARQNFHHIFLTFLEMFRFVNFPKEEIYQRIQIKGVNHLEEARRRGKGVICASVHLGNFLIVPLRMGLAGHTFHLLARAEKDSRVEKVLLETREQFGIKTIYKGKSYFSLVKVLKENGILWLFMDQFPRSSDLEVLFLTRPFPLYDGFARLARMTGAAIVPLTMSRLGRKIHQIQIFPAIPGDSEGVDQEGQAKALMGLLERQIRLRPWEWLWWHKDWFRPL